MPLRVVDRLRRRRRDHGPHAPEPEPRRGFGEPPSEEAGDAELDTLRGELVRELDRVASHGDGSSCLRRV